MRIVPQIIAALKADADVVASTEGKIFAHYPPQGDEKPFLNISLPRATAHGSVSNCQVRAYSAQVTVDIVSDTRASTEIGIEAIENVLDGFTSSNSDFPIQGVTLDGGISWELLVPKDGSDERAFMCSQDYQVHYLRYN